MDTDKDQRYQPVWLWLPERIAAYGNEPHFANIGRKTDVATQNMQRFYEQFALVRRGCGQSARRCGRARRIQSGTMLLLDESADDQSGTHTVGSGRQYNGRRGGVIAIVGVFLSCVDASCQYHTWIDGELFLVEDWFTDAWAERRRPGCR